MHSCKHYNTAFLSTQSHNNRRTNTAYDVTAIDPGARPPPADPLYSVINQNHSLPPALPPDRVPYYQELQSDAVPYQEPTSSVKSELQTNHTSCYLLHTDMKMGADPGMKMEANVMRDGVEPYQEPADALKYEKEKM